MTHGADSVMICGLPAASTTIGVAQDTGHRARLLPDDSTRRSVDCVELGQILFGFALIELHKQSPLPRDQDDAWPCGLLGTPRFFAQTCWPSKLKAANSPFAKIACHWSGEAEISLDRELGFERPRLWIPAHKRVCAVPGQVRQTPHSMPPARGRKRAGFVRQGVEKACPLCPWHFAAAWLSWGISTKLVLRY